MTTLPTTPQPTTSGYTSVSITDGRERDSSGAQVQPVALRTLQNVTGPNCNNRLIGRVLMVMGGVYSFCAGAVFFGTDDTIDKIGATAIGVGAAVVLIFADRFIGNH